MYHSAEAMASIAAAMHASQQEHLKKLDQKARGHTVREENFERDKAQWPASRVYLHRFLLNSWFEGASAVVILFNMVLVIIETDADAGDFEAPYWVDVMMIVCLSLYTVELAAKLYAFRMEFFMDRWNHLDFMVVFIDWVLIILGTLLSGLPSLAILRVFRLARLVRAVKAARFFKELHALIRSFTCAVKAIFWGLLMIFLCLVIWGILAVQLIHPINLNVVENSPHLYEGCDRCPRAFSSVFNSMLTLFQQLVAGDAWGEVSNPIIEEAPWSSVFFLMVLMTVNLTMLNLILTVILEAGAAAAAEDEHENAIKMHKKVMKAEKKLIELCEHLDTDGSGALNIQEFMDGFSHNNDFKDALHTMNVNEADIQMIFNICDEDGSGDVNYHEFVEQLRRIKDSGEKMLLYYVTDVRHMVTRLKYTLGVQPTRNTAVMAKHKEDSGLVDTAAGEQSSKSQQPKDRDAKAGPPKVDERSVLPLPPVDELTGTKESFENEPLEHGKDTLSMLIDVLQKQMMGILQSIPTKVDAIANTQSGHIARINEDLTSIQQQTKLQTNLLNSLVGEVTTSARRSPSRSCALVMPGFSTDAEGGANNSVETDGGLLRARSSSNAGGQMPGCCVRVV